MRSRPRFFVLAIGGRRRPLAARDLAGAISEAATLDHSGVGRMVDIWQFGRHDPVAVDVEVKGRQMLKVTKADLDEVRDTLSGRTDEDRKHEHRAFAAALKDYVTGQRRPGRKG